MDIRGRAAIVTGASSGIGRAVALELARAGVNVALAARRESELAVVADQCRALGVMAEVIATDVRSRELCFELASRAASALGSIDILVNNAGFAIFDPIATADPDHLTAMMETNYFGAVWCTQAVLPSMLERKSGSIINISSISGIMGYAGMSGYCATKFALTGFTEALRDEVISKGIEVSLICPGTTRTEFFVTAEKGKMPAASRLILAIPPERIGRAVVRAARRQRYRKIIPAPAHAYMRLKELFPRVAHFFMRRVSGMLERKSQ